MKKVKNTATGAQAWAPMSDGLQWCAPDQIGLRFVGWTDELRDFYSPRDRHTGWFTSEDGWTGEVLRGCVFQIPARHGKAVFFPGYREGSVTKKGWEDTCGEYNAAVHFKDAFSYTDADEAKKDAARAADEFARIAAEKQREYNTAWQAGSRYAQLRECLALARKDLHALIRELKAAREHGPMTCKALRATVRAMRAQMQRDWKEAQELKDAVWRETRDAFNEGAGEIIA